MINFKRAQSFASGTVDPMNKGVILTNTGNTASIFTLTCLTPTGATANVTYVVGQLSSEIVPLYVRGWTASGGTPSVAEVN